MSVVIHVQSYRFIPQSIKDKDKSFAVSPF
jgi:hypothetical protein